MRLHYFPISVIGAKPASQTFVGQCPRSVHTGFIIVSQLSGKIKSLVGKKNWCTKAAYKAYNMHWTVDRYFMLMRWTAFLFIIGQWGFDEKALQISCESWSRHARGNTSAERRGFQVTNNDMLSCTSFETHTHTRPKTQALIIVPSFSVNTEEACPFWKKNV